MNRSPNLWIVFACSWSHHSPIVVKWSKYRKHDKTGISFRTDCSLSIDVLLCKLLAEKERQVLLKKINSSLRKAFRFLSPVWHWHYKTARQKCDPFNILHFNHLSSTSTLYTVNCIFFHVLKCVQSKECHFSDQLNWPRYCFRVFF